MPPRGSSGKPIIVLATVAETVRAIPDQKLSQSDIEESIKKAAVDCGATGDLLAAVIHYLPQFYMAVRSANLGASESNILPPMKPQYEIWTQGQHKIVKDMSIYQEKKNQYLFWADITAGEYNSLGQQRPPLSAPALRLLLYLAENIGMSVPRSMVFERVIGEAPDGLQGWQSRLAHYLTELQNFAEEDFRKLYLPPPDRLTDSLTLKKTFRNQYFVFVTWTSPEKQLRHGEA
jgi:hypothetical protein